MKLEDVSAVVRPRGHWEGVDLGLALTRRYFPRILLSWMAAVWPLWVVLIGLSVWLQPVFILFLLWWLRPLYGRVVLFILSRAMFGAVPTVGQVLRAWPALLVKGIGRALFADRLSLRRGLLLPVTLLEGQTGRGRKQRAKVIGTHSGATASMLGVLCSGYELVMVFAVFGLAEMLIPEGMSDGYFEVLLEVGFVREIPVWLIWGFGLAWLVSLMFVEIFYIGGCFGLYLNCRTQTEGWDVEIAFRRMARRFGAVLVTAALLLPAALRGQEIERADDGIAPERLEKKEQIARVLADEDFKVHKVQRRVPEEVDTPEVSLRGLETLGYVLFWLLAAALIGWLVWWLVKNLPTLRSGPAAAPLPKRAGPRTVMGMDLAPESLPADVLAAARERWGAGDAHGALSLLYRGSLSWLVNVASLPLRDSDTEGDCVRLARKLPDAGRARYFSALTSAWVKAAYAARQPREEEMETLFGQWPFGGKEAA